MGRKRRLMLATKQRSHSRRQPPDGLPIRIDQMPFPYDLILLGRPRNMNAFFFLRHGNSKKLIAIILKKPGVPCVSQAINGLFSAAP
jgi:hypothetical protein